MAQRNKAHLLVPNSPIPEPFTRSSAGGSTQRPPFTGNRKTHGTALKTSLEDAAQTESPAAAEDEQAAGTYLTFVSFPGLDLALESLDPRNAGAHPELVSVVRQDTADGVTELATVFIPDGGKKYFLSRIDRYVETADLPKAKNASLIDSIQYIRRATIRELWTDDPEDFPIAFTKTWWEVWLRKRDGKELERLSAYAASNNMRMGKHHLGFGDRTVALVHATTEELGDALNSLDDLAELRRPHEVAAMITMDSAAEQAEWVDELLSRVSAAPHDAPAACIIDTGVQVNHPLLRASLDVDDAHAIDASWSPDDRAGHGTEMAGLALYGDLGGALVSSLPVVLSHKLESVKFLPDPSSTNGHDKELYGAVTAKAVDRPEIHAPKRARVFPLLPLHLALPPLLTAKIGIQVSLVLGRLRSMR